MSFVGELGWELHVRNEDAVDLYEALRGSFEALGLEFVNGGFRALNSLSIEKGYPHWHHEIRYENHE